MDCEMAAAREGQPRTGAVNVSIEHASEDDAPMFAPHCLRFHRGAKLVGFVAGSLARVRAPHCPLRN